MNETNKVIKVNRQKYNLEKDVITVEEIKVIANIHSLDSFYAVTDGKLSAELSFDQVLLIDGGEEFLTAPLS